MIENKYNGMLFMFSDDNFYLRKINGIWRVYLCSNKKSLGTPICGGLAIVESNIKNQFWKPLKWGSGHIVCQECI